MQIPTGELPTFTLISQGLKQDVFVPGLDQVTLRTQGLVLRVKLSQNHSKDLAALPLIVGDHA